MEKERCINCDELTDEAGQFEDSLFVCDYGPLCIDCHSVLDFGCLEIFDTKIKQLEDETQRLKSEMRWRRDETSI